MQTPPMVSAVKVGGERLYKRARRGEEVERPARPVTVHEFTMLGVNLPDITFRVRCTSGTYVRALCHEVGRELGCGGALASLRRIQTGRFSVADATPLDELKEPGDVQARLVSMADALALPNLLVAPERRTTVAAGNPLGDNEFVNPDSAHSGWVQIKTTGGELLAIGQLDGDDGGLVVRPKRVFCVEP